MTDDLKREPMTEQERKRLRRRGRFAIAVLVVFVVIGCFTLVQTEHEKDQMTWWLLQVGGWGSMVVAAFCGFIHAGVRLELGDWTYGP